MAYRTTFTPKYPQKYNGTYPIVSRSSWELQFMQYCDLHDDVMQWSSESIKIPYTNPLTGKQTIYIPDFLVTYRSKSGIKNTKLIEIKPLHEASAAHARNTMDVAVRVKNEAKWGAATQWSDRRGISFLVLTEAELFNNHANRSGRKHPIRARGKEQIKAANPTKTKRASTKASLSPAAAKRALRRKKASGTKSGTVNTSRSRTTKKVGKIRKR